MPHRHHFPTGIVPSLPITTAITPTRQQQQRQQHTTTTPDGQQQQRRQLQQQHNNNNDNNNNNNNNTNNNKNNHDNRTSQSWSLQEPLHLRPPPRPPWLGPWPAVARKRLNPGAGPAPVSSPEAFGGNRRLHTAAPPAADPPRVDSGSRLSL